MKASDREKAVLFALAAGQLADGWKEAFILSSQKSEKDVTKQKNITTSAERWRRRPEIIKAYEKALAEVEEMKNDARKEKTGQEEPGTADRSGGSNRTENERNARIDYYNPENQRRQINKIIQQSQDDPKTQLDAIKAIQQTQRDDRQAAKDNQVQRFYSPLRCHGCPLHEKEEERQRRRAAKS